MAYTPTILAQLINQVSRLDFASHVKDNNADKYVKSLFSWNLFTLLVFGHLAEVKSMRHLILVFNSAVFRTEQKRYRVPTMGGDDRLSIDLYVEIEHVISGNKLDPY